MKIEHGRAAVWQHAAEANMQDAIKKIAAIFDIDDIAIFTPGKLTYLKNKPVKYNRICPLQSDVVINPITGAISAKEKL
ncbi:Uncharacterised protein [Serratia quinivorans]|uniref:hypothetical protein n=1 Tax=Serratia quinivorans TaxID=137545 RepID=UPI00217A1FD5|nr:hypothetical protein [Serratia quinivorans]CAI1622154.1 Uncharacterised protein [Serratia quinivorans]CAI2395330.1 Uncharacterised protein [Serratia quinivorans]